MSAESMCLTVKLETPYLGELNVPRLTRQQAAIIFCATGCLLGPIEDVLLKANEIMNRNGYMPTVKVTLDNLQNYQAELYEFAQIELQMLKAEKLQ